MVKAGGLAKILLNSEDSHAARFKELARFQIIAQRENPPLAIPGSSAAPGGAPGGEPDPEVGEALMAQASPTCSSCHGADYGGQGNFPSLHGVAGGPVSENLQDLGAEYPDNWAQLWIAGNNPETEGIDRMGMPAFGDQFSPEQLDSIVAYLKSLQ